MTVPTSSASNKPPAAAPLYGQLLATPGDLGARRDTAAQGAGIPVPANLPSSSPSAGRHGRDALAVGHADREQPLSWQVRPASEQCRTPGQVSGTVRCPERGQHPQPARRPWTFSSRTPEVRPRPMGCVVGRVARCQRRWRGSAGRAALPCPRPSRRYSRVHGARTKRGGRKPRQGRSAGFCTFGRLGVLTRGLGTHPGRGEPRRFGTRQGRYGSGDRRWPAGFHGRSRLGAGAGC